MLLVPPPDAMQPPGLYWPQTGECLLFGETSAEARVAVGAMRLPLDDAGVARLPVALPPGERLALVVLGRAPVPLNLCPVATRPAPEPPPASTRFTRHAAALLASVITNEATPPHEAKLTGLAAAGVRLLP